MSHTPDIKTIISRVTDYGRKPTTPIQVLKQARALLAEEGNWVKGTLFEDGDPKEAYEKAACGKWGVCTLGAVGIVSGEMPVQVERFANFSLDRRGWLDAINFDDYEGSLKEFVTNPPENAFEYEWAGVNDITPNGTPLAYRAAEYLAVAIDPTFDPIDYGTNGYYHCSTKAETIVADYNDSPGRTRTQVLALFDEAIEAAKGDPLAKARAAKKAER